MKKTKTGKFVRLLLFVVIIVVLYFSLKKGIGVLRSFNELRNKQETFSGDSASLKNTVILAAFDAPLVPEKNNIWCNSFQLAWNELKDTVIREPITIIGTEDLSQRLNNSKTQKTDLTEDSYYVAAGWTSDGIIDKIRNDMANQFPSVPLPEFDAFDVLVAYAYLESYIKFTVPFRDNDEPFIFTDSHGNTTPLKSFGVWGGSQSKYKPLREQIDVLYCKTDENFEVVEYVLDLCKDTQPYQIVISNIAPQGSLKGTCDQLHSKIKAFRDDPQYEDLKILQETDVLQVPEMFWKITHEFTELKHKPLANQNFKGMSLSQAAQMIAFRLDRAGVTVISESYIEAACIPRLFILNKPFLVYVKKRDAELPFFVMWVDNAELLTPFTGTVNTVQ